MAGTEGAFRLSCLRARLFGVLRLERDGGQVHLPAKVGSLLAYLILHPGPQPREKMAALLWGDVPDEQARHSLRTALNHIRKELDDGLVAGDRDSILLNPSFPLWVDVREFVQRIGSITEAPPGNLALFDLYRGELLADLDDEWVFPERERYARQYEEALLRTAQHARSAGRYDWAIVLARQVLARDPANERAHQHVMFCLAASGDRAAALRQYEACRRALRDELDAPPASETDALRDWIRQTDCRVPSGESLVTNLPAALTRLVGRGEERLRIKGLLARGECAHDASSGSRLLTLTGAGGSGKTRLAIEVARELVGMRRDGAWWVDLASVGNAALVPQAVARALGLREPSRRSIVDTLVEHMRSKELLLLLDNCEHVADTCARLASELLAVCPDLTILATSRGALGVAGERVFAVPCLAVPAPGQEPTLGALRQFDAVELFLDRACAANPEFALTAENSADVVRICTQLDGIPLAIELAAAFVRLLTVEQIAARLVNRFSLPAVGGALLPRHRTLRASMDWSYDLIGDKARDLLQRLSVFVGGFSLAAAEAVCDGGRIEPGEALDLLARIVGQSLIVAHVGEIEARYGQLETTRQYAADRLAASAGEADTRRRHARYFAALADGAECGLRTPEMHLWLRRLEADHDNLRAALGWSLDHESPEACLRFAKAMGIFWSKRGYLREGRQWLDRLLAHCEDAEPQYRVRALVPAVWFSRVLGDYERAATLNEEALLLCRQVGDRLGLAEALNQRGAVSLYTCDFNHARACFGESLALLEELRERWLRAVPLVFLAHTALFALEWDACAKARGEEGLALFTEMDDRSGSAHAQILLGLGAHFERDDDRARVCLEQAVDLSRQAGDQRQLAMAAGVLSLILHFLGRWREGLPFAREALRSALDLGEKTVAAQAFQFLTHLAHDQGDLERAVHLMGYAQGWGESFGFRLAPMMRHILDPELEAMRARLGDRMFAEAWAAGRAMTESQALTCAFGTGG